MRRTLLTPPTSLAFSILILRKDWIYILHNVLNWTLHLALREYARVTSQVYPLPPPPLMLLPPMNTTCTDASAAVARKTSTARALVKIIRHDVKNKENSRIKARRHICVGIYARAKIAMVGRTDAKTTRTLLTNRSMP